MVIEEKRYPLKWGVCYKGRPYMKIYGKKKAYDLLYFLSKSFDGLTVHPIPPGSVEKSMEELDKQEYYKRWRERNKEKVRAYQREYYHKRRKLRSQPQAHSEE